METTKLKFKELIYFWIISSILSTFFTITFRQISHLITEEINITQIGKLIFENIWFALIFVTLGLPGIIYLTKKEAKNITINKIFITYGITNATTTAVFIIIVYLCMKHTHNENINLQDITPITMLVISAQLIANLISVHLTMKKVIDIKNKSIQFKNKLSEFGEQP